MREQEIWDMGDPNREKEKEIYVLRNIYEKKRNITLKGKKCEVGNHCRRVKV